MVAGIIGTYRDEPGNLLPVLLEINRRFNWLPRAALEHVSDELKIPLTEILRVASFYNAFSLKPKGKHVIRVCTGTACYVKGAQRILDGLARALKVEVGDMTEDGQFSLETVNCVGCCGQSPVMTVDDDIYGYVNQTMAQDVLGRYT